MISSLPLARPGTAVVALACIAMLAAACGATSGSSTTSATTAKTAPASTVLASTGPASTGRPSTGPANTVSATPVSTASSGPARQTTTPTGADTFIAEGQDINGTPWHTPACRSGCILSGDGTSVLYGMTWSTWTGTEAVGTGTENIEDCVPNCASGGQYKVAVVATFSQPVRDCAAPSGTTGPSDTTGQSGTRWFWSRASFRYPAGLPKALQGANAPKNPWIFTALIAQAKQGCS